MTIGSKIAPPPELVWTQLQTDADTVLCYAELTADFNPIHLDREFAMGTPFGVPIIHGTLGLNLVVESLERTFGALPAGVSIEVRFSRPVPVGSIIRAGGSLRDATTRTYEIFVETLDGPRALEGACVIGALD